MGKGIVIGAIIILYLILAAFFWTDGGMSNMLFFASFMFINPITMILSFVIISMFVVYLAN